MTDSTHHIDRLGVALLAVALLMPVGDAPWFSFWREWTASIAVLLIVLGAISTMRDLGIPLLFRARSLSSVALGLALLSWLQWATGLVPYHSDALLASLYFAGFAFCVVVASSLPHSQRDLLADRLAFALLVAALVSTPMAILQWIGWLRLDLGMRVAGGRPIAHMEQANLLCSLLIQGALGTWRLVARKRLRPRIGALLCVPILLCIVLTQSRVAWLAAAAIVAVAIWRREVLGSHSLRQAILASVAIVAIGTLLLPWLDGHFGLTGSALSERVSEGRRPAAWQLFVDAAMARPWTGWGVLQNGAAQFALADRHPPLAYLFSSAHNVVLDLVIWFGIPIGLFAGAALLIATLRRIARAPNGAALAPALAAVMLALHGLVELPLQYAYFLLPLGLFMGVTCADHGEVSGPVLSVSTSKRAMLPATALVVALTLAVLGREYIRVSDIRPVLAIDTATRVLVLQATLPLPEVVVLDQLKAFHAFAALQITPGQPAADLDAARAALLRAPNRASIEHYALVMGVNGRGVDARDALIRLCKFETPIQCEMSQRVWALWRERWPALPSWPE